MASYVYDERYINVRHLATRNITLTRTRTVQNIFHLRLKPVRERNRTMSSDTRENIYYHNPFSGITKARRRIGSIVLKDVEF